TGRILHVDEPQPSPGWSERLVAHQREPAIVCQGHRVGVAFGRLRLGEAPEQPRRVRVGNVEHDHAQIPVRKIGGPLVWTTRTTVQECLRYRAPTDGCALRANTNG